MVILLFGMAGLSLFGSNNGMKCLLLTLQRGLAVSHLPRGMVRLRFGRDQMHLSI